MDEVLTGQRVRLRPVRSDDEAVLIKIFSDPEVARWWGDPARSVRDSMNLEESESGFIIESGGEPIGYIQCTEEADAMYEHASIDISLRSEWQGKGLGPEAIRILAEHLVRVRGHHRLTIDPAAHNTRAIRAYERVGFRPVGIMRKYERGLDGSWHDGLLMEMLAEELLPSS
ncbi:MAG TPA: GNAT family protein [Candidatus Dormibacteraeota bacterium]|nr:GNAT family protein [Candidatus Dormibacteraeota bacterium]